MKNTKKELKWNLSEHPERFHHPDWQFDQVDCLRYYLDQNKTFPNSSEWRGDNNLCVESIIDFLSGKNYGVVSQRNFSQGIRQIILYSEVDQILFSINCYAKAISSFESVDEEVAKKAKNNKIIVTMRFDVLHNGLEKPAIIDELVKASVLKEDKSRATVNIISRDINGFKLVEVNIDTQFNENFDLHYGKGFNEYHNTLVDKILNTHKGIVIFHGDPGTGKTCYIRTLLSALSASGKKRIIILPNTAVNYILEPDFTDFMLEMVEELSYIDEFEEDLDDEVEAENSIVLVIEDGESVLMKREDSGNQGTSNILNMTDGIMNDVFGFQVIATFNTDLQNIDKAVLRSKRLISRKTFNKLSVEDSQNLIDHLKIEHTASEPLSVADIYSLMEKEENSILIEDDNLSKKHGKIDL